ncbi:Starch-binding associating with outer membrane [Cnuella takakiae]|uniref:Starch-binding associating with outer membrane n=1 Tax=Cnuella takakiae TaxID=1302690 RepID=A0A1M4Z533_9BACT|nr:RagB/SusD family nutrient uptake outer membrane protein [Cnuella takakiae]OLY95023.1 RagB/SusD family nutrient uptake outer membrane protein [Cnuella takakiae]SHF12696.1 Starch-binding associating with outer membrane [Cnuella takakiae]
MKKIYIGLLAAVLGLAACDKLDQLPESTASRQAVFGSENGLRLYTNSFYNMGFLTRNSTTMDAMTDYLAVRSVQDFIRPGGFAANNSSGWSWSDLRNINYFIVNCNNPAVPEATRNNYLGLARYFRAFFYFDKVERFGDVPWINRPLDITDSSALNAGRDSRTLVMDSVLADLDFACNNIQATSDPSRTTVTKWVAYALKSRICLFEGTYRKYHTELNLAGSANRWLEESASAAKFIMDNGGFSINTAGGDLAYRNVFISNAPLANEVLQASVADVNLGVLNEGNWWWTSGTYGAKASFTRTFINTYLKIDGTPFTNTPGYQTMLFKDEVKNRDLRLKQTIRTPGYTRISNGAVVPAPPVFSYTFTGYQPIKWVLDDMRFDAGALNTNAIPLFRFAEVLLNYAEAKAELGALTDAEWAQTIGVLRGRAGITGGLQAKPMVADPYLIANYFPGISDPAILEVRRERGIELSLEGVRFADLLRWKRGELMEQVWNGFYVPALNTPMDLNEDGINDVLFYQGTAPAPIAGVTFVNVSPTIGGAVNSQRLSNNTSGELTWMTEIPRDWTDKNYLYPIPLNDLQRNPRLGQNPGWE